MQRVLDLLRSTYLFDVDVNLFMEDARVACAAVSKSVSLIHCVIMGRKNQVDGLEKSCLFIDDK